MSEFFSKKYSNLVAYTPGEQPKQRKFIKLNTNESPYPPPSVMADKVKEQVENLRLYSDPENTVVTSKIAKLCEVESKNVLVTNGSDEILNFAFMAFGESGVVFPDISYGFYEVFASLHGLSQTKIALKDDFSIDYKDYLNLNKMIVIANPNAPTSLMIGLFEIEEILKSNKNNVVVIDEAYIDFGGISALPLVKKYDNLLVTQTFSKSRSLAGARLGFGVGSEKLINDLNTIKYSTNPYNVNSLSALCGAIAIDENAYFMEKCKQIVATREKVKFSLEKLGFVVLDSKSNFLFAKSKKFKGREIYDYLREEGILVRHFEKERISDYVRITVGSEEEMQILIEKLETLMKR